MPLIYLLRDFDAGFRQGNKILLVNEDISSAFQQVYCAGYAGLGITHVFADVNGAHTTEPL